RNRTTILNTMTKFGDAWWFICDSFVGMGDNVHRQLLGTMNDALKSDFEPIQLTPKTEIFDLLDAWARDAEPPPAPTRPRDWLSVGDIAHWLGHANASGTLRRAIEAILPHPLPTDLRLEELALFVSGRAQLCDS